MIKQIGILGIAVSSGNRGVQALGSSLVNLCSREDISQAVLLAGHNAAGNMSVRVCGKQKNIPIVNYRLSFKSGLKHQLFWIVLMSLLYKIVPVKLVRTAISGRIPWISAVEKCQIVGDVRGGDSFSDIYGMKRFVFGFLAAWSVILVKGSMVQFPQTYGPFKTRTAQFLAKFLLKRSSIIVARDTISQAIAQKIVGPQKKVLFSPDVAFSLEIVQPKSIEFDPPTKSQNTGRPIGINVNGLMHCGGYTRKNMFGLKMEYVSFMRELTMKLLEISDQDVWLVPHTFAPHGDPESDNEACINLRNSLSEALRQRVAIVSGNYDQHEIKGIIGQCDFFVGGRMHSCIAALSQGIPCIGTAYSMKFKGVFDSVHAGDWVVDGKVESNDEALEHCKQLFERQEEMRIILEHSLGEARAALSKVFSEIVSKF